ncbi:MAG: hypothetical protein ABS92_11045 [Thiobacillus sp. SCN 63-374]|nr:MAG: hypothetical protein ABS92_11045 [Thiobacillus sp. SCN 63-374]
MRFNIGVVLSGLARARSIAQCVFHTALQVYAAIKRGKHMRPIDFPCMVQTLCPVRLDQLAFLTGKMQFDLSHGQLLSSE